MMHRNCISLALFVALSLGSADKEARMQAIGRYINQTQHDVYMLEELWMNQRPVFEH